PGTREYSCAVLKDCGYRVLAAQGGEDALRVWAKHRDEIDLVVTDLMMPRTSGVDVYRTLRQQRSDVPVIVVSGYPLVAEMLGARQEGVVECRAKPVAPEQLAASVRRALAHQACAGWAPAAPHPVRPRIPGLVLVTDRHASAGRDLVAVVAAALDAGLPAVQLRDKDLPGGPLFALAERLRAAAAQTGALLFVNDRLDVALAVGADGVHLGGGSVP